MSNTVIKLNDPKDLKINIVINSIFSDHYCERELIARYIIPPLRLLCAQENIELEFTDLQSGRWIENELDTLHLNFCHHELKKCSNSPSILINLLGDKYGPRSLPEELTVEEYQVIRQEALALMFTRQVKYLDHWYKKDCNQLPPCYRLVSIRDFVSGYTDLIPLDPDTEHAMNCFIQRKTKFLFIFNTAIKSIIKQNLLEQRPEFVLSDFNSNLQYYLSEGENSFTDMASHSRSCLVFLREFLNFSTEDVNLAEKYSDVNRGSTRANKRAQNSLTELKNEIFTQIPQENIASHEVKWTDCGVKLNYTRHKNYLTNFLQRANTRVNQLITELINTLKPIKIAPDSASLSLLPSRHNITEEEITYHLRLCQQKAPLILDSIVNYDDIIDQIVNKMNVVENSSEFSLEKLMEWNDFRFDAKMATHWPGFKVKSLDPQDSNSSDQTKYLSEIKESILTSPSKMSIETFTSPVIVEGGTGYFKSALVSTLYYRLCNIDPNAIKIVRFFGTSPNCSTLSGLMRQLIYQIANSFHFRVSPVLLEDPDLVFIGYLFRYLLYSIPPGDKNLFILIAGLEKLSPKEKLFFERIFPHQTPSRVKIVITLRDCGGLKSISVVKVPNVEKGRLEQYVADKFSLTNRTLTKEQNEALMDAIGAADSPLLVKYLVDKALYWQSQGNLEGVRLPSLMQEYSWTYMEKMEKAHGKILVAKFFSYLTLSRFGLTKMELEDILSLDNEALKQTHSDKCFEKLIAEQTGPSSSYSNKEEAIQHCHARLPSLVVARIIFDLGDHVIQRAVPPGTRYLINFCHDVFKQTAVKKYLTVPGSSKDSSALKRMNKKIIKMNQLMADYYLGKWAHKAKPIKLNVKTTNPTEYEFLRDVPPQPNCFNDVHPNYRKIVELEHLLLAAHNWQILISHCLLSPSWLLWRLRVNGGFCRLVIDDWSSIAETILTCHFQSAGHSETGVVNIVKSICDILEKIGPTIMTLDSNMLINQVIAVLLKERQLSPAQKQIFDSYQHWLTASFNPQLIPRDRCGPLRMYCHLATWKLNLRHKSKESSMDEVVNALPDGSVAALSQDSSHSTRLHLARLHQVPILGTTHYIPLSVAAVKGIVCNTSILWMTVHQRRDGSQQMDHHDILFDILSKQIVLGSLECQHLFDLHFDTFQSKLAVYVPSEAYISIYELPNTKTVSMHLLVPEEFRKEIVRLSFSLEASRCVALCRSGCVISWFLIVLPEDFTHERIMLTSSNEVTTMPIRRQHMSGNQLVNRITFPSPNYSSCFKALSSDRFVLTQFCDNSTCHHLVMIDIKRNKAQQLANHMNRFFIYDLVSVSENEKFVTACSSEITPPANLLPPGVRDKPILIWDLLLNELACYILNDKLKNILTLEFLSEDSGLLVVGYAGDKCLELWQVAGSFSSAQKSAQLVSYIDTRCEEALIGARVWTNQHVMLCLQGSGLATLMSTQVIEFETNKRLTEHRKLSLKSDEEHGGEEDVPDSLCAKTTGSVVMKNYKVLAVTRSSGWFYLYSIRDVSLKKSTAKHYPTSISNLRQNNHLVLFSGAISVYMWDVSTKTEIRKFSVPNKSPLLCYSVGQDILVLGGGSLGKRHGFVFSISEDRHISTLSCKHGFDMVEVNKDDNKVITNSFTIPVVFDVPSCNPLSAWPSSDREEPCLSLCLSSDDLYSALACQGTIRVIFTDNGSPICRLRVPNRLRAKGGIKFMQFLPSCLNRSLFTTVRNEFVIWSIQSGKIVRIISHQTEEIEAICFSEDCLVMASASVRQDVSIFDTDSWLPLAAFMTEHIPSQLCFLDDNISGLLVDLPGVWMAGKFAILETNDALRQIIQEKRNIKRDCRSIASSSIQMNKSELSASVLSDFNGRLSAISGTFTGRHSEFRVHSFI